ncbi:argininosuccinate synthase [Candidatus Sumerlaeota bacterium]|nr:argininosuccinate synthase [Candidatus Sumerlaeota bacterium]
MSKTKNKISKVVLAYSGGLDTSVIIRWLIENYGCEVVAFIADMGQGENLNPIRQKALKTGATKAIVKDLRQEFVQDFVIPAIKANLLYEGKYPMATSLGRPLIAKWLVEVAKSEKADAIAHGCTGKGNDQVRFELTAFALAPEMKVIVPIRESELKTRDVAMEYARKYKIPVPVTKKKPYSIDRNLYGISIECGVLEDPWVEPPEDAFLITRPISKTPKNPLEITIGFKEGVPVRLNGKRMSTLRIIQELTALGGKYGIGRIDLVENRLVGIKSREVYEAPAATILLTAHKELEAITLDRETMHFKEMIVPRYAELVYYGQWYTPLREAFAAFVDSTQKFVTGDVRLKLHKGQCIPVGRRSPYSLYQKSLATYEVGDMFDHSAAAGFISLFGLPIKVQAMARKTQKSK